MASEAPGLTGFSLGLVARAMAISVLGYAALELAVQRGLYATALVICAAAGLVFLSLWRAVARADRLLARFVDGVVTGQLDRPAARTARGFAQFGGAVERAAEALRAERQERQRRLDLGAALLDSVPAALIVVEPAGGVTLANRAARSLAGRDVARLADIGPLAASAERLLALPPGGRTLVELADGRTALASAIGFATPEAGRRLLLCLQDIALLDAVEMKAWQDVVHVLAHEMLNSLTPIVSLAETLQQGERPKAEVAGAIEVIGRRSRGLMTFVDGYRKAAQTPAPKFRPVALRPWLAGLEDLLGPLLAKDGLAYASRVEPEDLVVAADPDLLEQAAINLVKNAAEAVAGVAQPAIAVSCRDVGGWVELTVRDNGPGVARDDLQRMFVPFFTTKPGGSGIGLSIARQIALAHRGRLDVAAAPGGGTAFTLAWPAAPEEPTR